MRVGDRHEVGQAPLGLRHELHPAARAQEGSPLIAGLAAGCGIGPGRSECDRDEKT
jgi:hypothetical protein